MSPTDTQIHSFLAHHGRELPLVHWPRVMGWLVFAVPFSAMCWKMAFAWIAAHV